MNARRQKGPTRPPTGGASLLCRNRVTVAVLLMPRRHHNPLQQGTPNRSKHLSVHDAALPCIFSSAAAVADDCLASGDWRLEIVKRSDAAGFEVLPKRWIVERTFA